MAKNNNLQDFLTDIANTIREENGTAALINPQDFGSKITGIADKLRNIIQGTVTEITPEMLTGITTLRPFAFSGYDNLTKITLPEGVTCIGDCAFDGCSSLVKLNLPNSLEQFAPDILLGPIGGTEHLEFNSDDNEFMYLGNDTNPYLVLWSGEVYDEAFAFQPGTKIISGGYGFYIGTPTLNIPDQIISVEYSSINGEAEVVNIGSGLKFLDSGAFQQLSNLREINVSDSNAFFSSVGGIVYDKSKTKFVQIPKNIATANIPNTVTSIPNRTFYMYKSLNSVTIPNSVVSIGSSAFSYCSKLLSIAIPSSVKSIGRMAFDDCTSMTSVTFGGGVRIDDDAFEDCTSLTNVVFPENTSCGWYSFRNCRNLTSVTFNGEPAVYNTFYGCSKVAKYDFRNATSIPTLSSSKDLGHAAGCKIIVPDALHDSWKAATNWAALTDVVWVKASEYTEE